MGTPCAFGGEQAASPWRSPLTVAVLAAAAAAIIAAAWLTFVLPHADAAVAGEFVASLLRQAKAKGPEALAKVSRVLKDGHFPSVP